MSRELAEKYLWENKFEPAFTVEKRLYYNFLRPMIPVFLRQSLQAKLSSKIKAKEFLIDDRLVNLIFQDERNSEALNHLYPDGYTSAIVLTHDVEAQSGFNFIPRIL
jgi:hypothetical protein